jgi:voltage-gated potassium channel
MSDPAGGAGSSAGSSGPAAGSPGGGGAARFGRSVRRNVLTLAAVLVAYYAAPVGDLPSGYGLVFSVVGLLAGMALLAWSILRQVQRLARRGPADESVRLESLVFLLYVAVPLFALGFYALVQADADQFAGLDTKTDALYFATSTVATVGFGDVHATGQLARVLVILQIVFNIVFVAAVGSVITSHLRERAAARRAEGGPATG